MDEAVNKNKLFVGNLSWDIKDSQVLVDHFSQFGEVTDATVLLMPDGRSKGFGFVTFANEEDAAKAKEQSQGVELMGRPINVDYAQPPRPREDRPARDDMAMDA